MYKLTKRIKALDNQLVHKLATATLYTRSQVNKSAYSAIFLHMRENGSVLHNTMRSLCGFFMRLNGNGAFYANGTGTFY